MKVGDFVGLAEVTSSASIPLLDGQVGVNVSLSSAVGADVGCDVMVAISSVANEVSATVLVAVGTNVVA